MKQKIEIVGFLVICIMVITFAIKAGKHHENCRECRLSNNKSATESAKFAGVWK